MTSEERREGRYLRRVLKRQEKKREQAKRWDDFDSVFSYAHLYRAYQFSRRAVAWKASVQRYITQAPLNVYQTYQQLQAGTFRSGGFYEFDIRERGKLRHIRSVTMSERVVQRCLCDYALVPALSRTFIYDNAASLKDRGYHFAMRRLCQHLHEHYRKYGSVGYVLLFDFHKFFDNVSHQVCEAILRREFTDERIFNLTKHFMDMFGDHGLGLGSQISQTFALASANRLDHYIKEVCRIRGYGRYMDDGYLIHHSKEYLHQCLIGIRMICAELGITLNEEKTQIVKLTHGFTYLKARVYLTQTGKILRKIAKASITRERRKLKKFSALFQNGRMAYPEIYTAWQSWRAYASNFTAWHTIQSMGKLYTGFFLRPWLTHA